HTDGGCLPHLAFAPAPMSFAYRAVDGMPGFVGDAVNRWSVESLDQDRSVVRVHATIELPRLKVSDRTVRTISTVMRFDTAVEVPLSELRVEMMFPADEASAAFFRSAAL